MKSSSYEDENEQDENDDFESKDPFATSDPFELTTVTSDDNSSGFNSIIGNNNISNPLMFGYHTTNTNGYDQSNDFLMNFYASQCTNYSPFTANPPPSSSSSLLNNYSHAINSCSSPYNPFHQHFCVLTTNNINNIRQDVDGDDDINSNNDNWANFDSSSDNFADFDSHFASMTPATFTTTTTTTEATDEVEVKEETNEEPTCFVATTQVLEISSAPPPQPPSPVKFQLGSNLSESTVPTSIISSVPIKSFDELDDEEFFSLRDDSNDMSSLTDDNDKKFTFENTEVPDDDDDDFASADER